MVNGIPYYGVRMLLNLYPKCDVLMNNISESFNSAILQCVNGLGIIARIGLLPI